MKEESANGAETQPTAAVRSPLTAAHWPIPIRTLSINEVRQHYAGAYLALNNASYEEEVTDNAVLIKFTAAVGSKG